MSDNVLKLINKQNEEVAIPEAVAKKLFGAADMDHLFSAFSPADGQTVAVSREPDASGGDSDDDDDDDYLVMKDLDYSLHTLKAVLSYANLPEEQRTTEIPQPLIAPLQHTVKNAELQLMRDAEAGGYHVELLDCAMLIKCKPLTALCGAYMAERVDEIAQAAETIMKGAEQVREFLQLENEWTEEEMVHLTKEMEYAKSIDPSAY